MRSISKSNKVYITELSDTIVSFFEKRKISQKTLIDFKVTESIEWMPRAGKEVKTINFNYFKNGELINREIS